MQNVLVKCPIKDFSKKSSRFVVGSTEEDKSGTMHYDKSSDKLLYVYNKEFLCFDTEMNLLYRSKRLRNVHFKKQSCISEGFLYVRVSPSLVDVFIVRDGRYCFSFDVPEFNRKNMTDFRVSENRLLVLYNKYLLSYDIEE